MDYKMEVTKEATAELENIMNYISESLAAPKAAQSFYDDFMACCNNILNNPYMYAACEFLPLKAGKYRKAVIKNYLMFYKVDEETTTICVYRLLYGRRNYTDLL